MTTAGHMLRANTAATAAGSTHMSLPLLVGFSSPSEAASVISASSPTHAPVLPLASDAVAFC